MSDDDYEPDRHITGTEYRAWLERQRPKLAAELTDLLPDWVRDAGMCFEFVVDPEQPPGTMTLKSGPHQMTAVNIGPGIPLRNEGILTYDYVPPKLPDAPWTPMRNVFSRWHSGKTCYTLPSGNMVHVKPDCRC